MEPLDWKDVDLAFRVVTFPRSKPGPGYEVPINDTALAALKMLRERGDGTWRCDPQAIRTHLAFLPTLV